MVNIAGFVEKMRKSPQNIRYDDLFSFCCRMFGEPRQQGSSHAVFKTPWKDDPRVNIQRGKNGQAKAYQVKQVVRAVEKMAAESEGAQ
ncbi:MAG: toxin HicA [Candidatus Adiutrix sp.]|jgi:hypothetical protein|nr:toxin HicA [Candidatus Adiutrix sp.]